MGHFARSCPQARTVITNQEPGRSARMEPRRTIPGWRREFNGTWEMIKEEQGYNSPKERLMGCPVSVSYCEYKNK